jgi:hypothetical protein
MVAFFREVGYNLAFNTHKEVTVKLTFATGLI